MEARCVEKCITIVSHPFLSVIHFTDINGTLNICNIYFKIVRVCGASAIVPQQNDHVWSFHSIATPSQPRLGRTRTRGGQFLVCTDLTVCDVARK